MKITNIEMELSAVIPHPSIGYANAQPRMSASCVIADDEDPLKARADLKAFLTEGFLEIAKEAYQRMQPRKAG